jgi:5-methylcytosine-specific restriction endonuclease McrA
MGARIANTTTIGSGEIMKKHTIKSHLAQYSILQKRTTTINHAFASAIAPVDKYDEVRLDAALRLLGQNPDGDLECVYCESPAETWDHLIGLVKKGELRGYGHQLGNLVPCCKKCNSEKGAKDWQVYLSKRSKRKDLSQSAIAEKQRKIKRYLAKYAPVNIKEAEEQWPDKRNQYNEIKLKILKLMEEADQIAKELRDKVRC